MVKKRWKQLDKRGVQRTGKREKLEKRTMAKRTNERRKERTKRWKEQRKDEREKGSERMAEIWNLCKGLSIEDYRWLHDMDIMTKNIFLFNMNERAVMNPESHQLPWTVVHTLAAKKP